MLHLGRILLYSALFASLVGAVFVSSRAPTETRCPGPQPITPWQPWPTETLDSDESSKPPTPDEIPHLIARLEALDPDDLFDYHGNDHELVQRLAVLRFEATAAVQDAIDRHESDPTRKKLVEELYGVLGFVKDPGSIPWLEAKLASPRRTAVYRHYMWHWHWAFGPGHGDPYAIGNWPWLKGRDRWIGFFIDRYIAEKSPKRRREHLAVLMQFADPAATAFFESERRTPPEPGIALLVEAAVHERGLPADPARIATAIEMLSPDEDNLDLLFDAAARLRHEAFVPFLIDGLGDGDYMPPHSDRHALLRNITYATDIASPDGWRTWYAKHQQQARETWVAEALQSFEAELSHDPCAAKQVFAKAVYAWNDLAALPLVRDVLLQRGDFDDEIAGWINLTYSPFSRRELRPIAETLARRADGLSEHSRALLRERGFLPSPPPETWAQHVASANMKI